MRLALLLLLYLCALASNAQGLPVREERTKLQSFVEPILKKKSKVQRGTGTMIDSIQSLSVGRDTLVRVPNIEVIDNLDVDLTAFDVAEKSSDSLRGEIFRQMDRVRDSRDSLNAEVEDIVDRVAGKFDNVGQRYDTVKMLGMDKTLPDISEIIPKELQTNADKLQDYKDTRTVFHRLPIDNLPFPDIADEAGWVKIKLEDSVPDLGDLDLDLDELNDLNKAPLIIDSRTMSTELDGKLAEMEIVPPGLSENVKTFTKELGSHAEYIQQDKDVVLLDIEEKVENAAVQHSGIEQAISAEGQLKSQKDKYEALIQKYRDKKNTQEEIRKKAQGITNEAINKKAPIVLESQHQLARLRSRRKFSVKSLLTSSSLEKKSFRDRFLPAITISNSPKDAHVFETGLQFGYRFSGSLSLGGGVVGHFSFTEQNQYFMEYARHHGYRLFGTLGLVKNFFLHGEIEAINRKQNGFIKGELPIAEALSYNIGISRKYDLSRRFKGSILALYRIQNEDLIPVLHKFNVRIGIEPQLGKRKRIVNGQK